MLSCLNFNHYTQRSNGNSTNSSLKVLCFIQDRTCQNKRFLGIFLWCMFLKHYKIQIFPSIFYLLTKLKLIWLVISREKPFFYQAETSLSKVTCMGVRRDARGSQDIHFPDLTPSIIKDFGLALLFWLCLCLANSQKKLKIPEEQLSVHNSLGRSLNYACTGPRQGLGCTYPV